MTFRALPAVQLVGFTSYIPPVHPDDDSYAPKAVLEPHVEAKGSESLIEFAGRGCYESWSRPTPATATIDGYLRNIFDSKHFSVIEHASASMWITGISRSCSHEIVRHRHMSFSQLSQRFVDESKLKIVVPPAIEERLEHDPDRCERWAEQTAKLALKQYNVEIERIKLYATEKKRKQVREAARAVLPNATETKMVLTGNYRSWMEFIVKRESPHADAEIQRLAQIVIPHLVELAPNIFGDEARQVWQPDWSA